MILPEKKDQDRWSRSSTWAKNNILPRIKEPTSPRSWLRDTKNAKSSHSSTPGHSMEMPPAESGNIGASSDAILQAALTDLNNSRSSHLSTAGFGIGKRPLHAGKSMTISDTIFDDDLDDVTPIRPNSCDFGDSNCTLSINTASAETGQSIINAGAVRSLSSADLESMKKTYYRFDGLTHAEVIETAPTETGGTAIIFGTMLDFSFQDTEGKWQAYYSAANPNPSPVIDTSQEEFGKSLRTSFGLFQRDVKGKKPVYPKLIEGFDNISSRYTRLVPEAPYRQASSYHPTRVASTSLICTCTPSDARLGLDLYLQSTKKQYKQLKHSLRRSGGLTYFVSSSTGNAKLVQKFSKLYLNVEELRRLVMAEEIVSSVTMTEIHRLMDKALTPVSQQVSTLYGEIMGMSVADDEWRRRRRAIKQKMKEDWKPRMRALSTMVDQAEAWVQLVVIRITRARWEW
jgi:hypothetical protein